VPVVGTTFVVIFPARQPEPALIIGFCGSPDLMALCILKLDLFFVKALSHSKKFPIQHVVLFLKNRWPEIRGMVYNR